MIKKICKFCQRRFEVFNYRNESAGFCSENCYHSHQKSLAYPTKECRWCHKIFQNNRSTRGRKCYCSKECEVSARYKHDSSDRICAFCKSSFPYSPRNPFQKYCVKECQHRASELNVNANFFDKIDSEIKAYLLGLLYSDGCISSSKSKNSTLLNFSSKDRELVELFGTALASSRQVGRYNNSFSLSIRNRKLIETLKKLGLKERKSWISYDLPPIQKKLIRHFLRGFYDGDGSYYLDNREGGRYIYLSVSLTCAHYDFLEKLKFLFVKRGIAANEIVADKRSLNGSYQLRVTNKDSVKKLIDYLFEDSNYHLSRKFNIIKNFYAKQV